MNSQESISTSPLPSKPKFDLRFILTEAEWREGSNLLHPIMGNGFNKPWLRLFLIACGVLNLIFPVLNGWSWEELIRSRPQSAVASGLGALFCFFLSTGFGMKLFNQRLNRLDLERHIVITDNTVRIEWNGQIWNHTWKDFVFFREGQSVVILRNPGVRFWTIPLRALPQGSEASFRQFLAGKLAKS